MACSPYSVKNTGRNEGAQVVYQALQTTNVKNLVASSQVVDYILNEKEYDYLSQVFGVPIKLESRSGELKHHPHGAAAFLNRFAYRECMKVAKTSAFDHTTIDIGGSPLRTSAKHHLCTLVNDMRTDARYTECAFTQLGNHISGTDWTGYIKSRKSYCVDGAQNCFYKADYAYMVNVYDISMQTIAEIFSKHDLTILDAWMFLPHCLISESYQEDQVIYKCRIDYSVKDNWVNHKYKPSKVTFHLYDASNVYTHDYDVWRSYITTTFIRCRDFGITVEHKRSFGTFTNIRFTRVSNTAGQITRCIPLATLIPKTRVPDFPNYIRHRFAIDPYSRCFLLETDFVNKILAYGASCKDEAFNFTSYSSYARASMSTIKYSVNNSQEILYTGIDLSSDDSSTLVQSLFLYSALQRFRRTHNIGAAFKHMKKNAEPGIFASFRQWLYNLEERWFEDPKTEVPYMDLKNFIYDIKIESVKDAYYSDVVSADVGSRQKPTSTSDLHTVYPSITPVHTFKSDGNITAATTTSTPHSTTTTKVQPPNGSHIRVIYNPPGDGYCGMRVINFYDPTIKVTLGKCGSPGYWMADDEMATTCRDNGWNFILHYNGQHYVTYNHGFSRDMRVDLSNQHYTAVDCDCNIVRHMVGDYSTMFKTSTGYSDKHLYVNCANEFLSDGAGQAKTFRTMFPGYDSAIKTPIQPVVFLKHQNTHLCLAVAHNNRVNKDHDKTHERYKLIFDAIDNYCNANNLTVLMPAIGTALFGTNTQCFRQHFDALSCGKIMCHFQPQGIQEFDKHPPCGYTKHRPVIRGGYDTISSLSNCRQVIKGEEKFIGIRSLQRNFNIAGKMAGKIKDLLKYLDNTRISLRFPALKSFYDMCMAPGGFYDCYHNELVSSGYSYYGAHYDGQDAFDLYKHVVPDFKYSNADIHCDHINNRQHFDNYIMDTQLDMADIRKYISSCLKNKYSLFISKHLAYDSVDYVEALRHVVVQSGASIQYLYNDYSDVMSSEVYFCISKVAETPKTFIYNEGELLDYITARNENKINEHVCSCEERLPNMMNTDLEVNCRPDDFVRYRDALKLGDVKFEDILQPEAFTMRVWNGVGGARKTIGVVKSTCPKCTLIVAPYADIIGDLRADNVNCATFTVALASLMRGKSYKNIVIDEIFAWPSAHIMLLKKCAGPNATVYGLGDSKQITDRCYDAVDNGCKILRGGYTLHTYRTPKVLVPIIQRYIPGFHTRSTQEGELLYKHNTDDVPKDHVIMTCTQELKKAYSLKHRNNVVCTVNEAQGRTFSKATFVTTDLNKLPIDRVRYVYVALSRVTHVLHVIAEDGGHEMLSVLDSAAERALEAINIPCSDTIVPDTTVVTEKIHYRTSIFEPLEPNYAIIEDVLDRCYKAANDTTIALGYTTNVIPEKENDQRLKFSQDLIAPNDVAILGKKIMPKCYQPMYHPKVKKQTIDCLIIRYAKEGKAVPKHMLDKYVSAFKRWLKPDALKYLRKEIDYDSMYKSTINYMRDLQKKYSEYTLMTDDMQHYIDGVVRGNSMHTINPDDYERALAAEVSDRTKKLFYRILKNIKEGNVNKFKDLQTEFYENYHKVVSFHLKRQVKEIRKPEYDTMDKAGQGISAWSKLLNIMFSTFTRTWSEKITFYIQDNVQLSYGKSDAEVSVFFKQYSKYINDTNYDKVVCDFSEFDSSQEQQCILSSQVLLTMAGVPKNIMEMYIETRSKWAIATNDELGTAVLNGQWQQHSGQPFTLDGNTMFNMTAIGACLQFNNLICAGFKGDDLFVVCSSYKHNEVEEKNIADLCGYKLKLESVRFAEYIANIITPIGFFPDVLRRVGRVVSKVYTTHADWMEIRESIADSLDVIMDDLNLMTGCKYASYYYAQYGIYVSENDVFEMVKFLKALSVLPSIDDFPLDTWKICNIYDNNQHRVKFDN